MNPRPLGQQNNVKCIKRISVCWEILGGSAGATLLRGEKKARMQVFQKPKMSNSWIKLHQGRNQMHKMGLNVSSQLNINFLLQAKIFVFSSFSVLFDFNHCVFLPLKQHVSGIQSMQHCITRLSLSAKIQHLIFKYKDLSQRNSKALRILTKMWF